MLERGIEGVRYRHKKGIRFNKYVTGHMNQYKRFEKVR
jgi:hypothetical protein